MKLILKQEVSGLGGPGDVVEVKDGYGRNYLLPQGLATAWSKGGEKQVAALVKGRAAREIKGLDEAKAVKTRLEAAPVTVAVKAGQAGRLFGAITPTEVVAAVKAAGGPDLDRRKVELPTPIKSTGAHQALVRLHPEVQATLTLSVVPS